MGNIGSLDPIAHFFERCGVEVFSGHVLFHWGGMPWFIISFVASVCGCCCPRNSGKETDAKTQNSSHHGDMENKNIGSRWLTWALEKKTSTRIADHEHLWHTAAPAPNEDFYLQGNPSLLSWESKSTPSPQERWPYWGTQNDPLFWLKQKPLFWRVEAPK